MADHLISILDAVDLTSFCKDSYEAGFISLAVKENCDSLDDNVSHSTKVRYLWLHVCQQVRENWRLWERLLTVLTTHGVPSYVLEELKVYLSDALSGYGGGDIVVGEKGPHGGLKYFTARHIIPLTEILSVYSSKYQEIAIALLLPRHVQEESRAVVAKKYFKSVFGLERVLREWILGQHKFTKPPTIENLQETLCSNIVGLRDVVNLRKNLLKIAVCLEEDESSTSCKRPCLDSAPLEVVSLAGDCVVREKSTLLEVQVCNGGRKYFTKRHIIPLTEMFSDYSSRYQEIALSLQLPGHVREESQAVVAKKYHKFVFGLERVLREWILGQHKFTKLPTIENLQETLRSNIVGLGDVANSLQQNLLKHGVCLEDDEPATSCKRPRLDTAPLEVVSQTRDCMVREGKSTLLEVQVCSTSSLSYQWMKDGSPLTDSTSDGYSGTETEILCIKNASLSSEGTYSCEIKCNEDQALVIHSEPLVVIVVKMSPLKKVLVKQNVSKDEEGDAEMEDFIRGIEEAVECGGKINRKLAHIMFVGPPGSGKSSLMDRLLGRLRKKFSSSTGVCDSIVIVDIDISNPTTFTSATLLDNTWKETECDASFVKQMREDSTHTQGLEDTPISPISTEVLPQPLHDVEVDTDYQATNSFAQALSSSDEPTKMMQPRNRPAEPNKTIMSPLSPKSVRLSTRPFESILSVIDKYGWNEFKEHLEKRDSLYLRDTGGQVEFQEMLALLISGPSIVIFVFRTDQDFRRKFEVCYRKSVSENLNSYTSSITTEEALLRSLASVHAMDTSDEDIVKTHEPLVFIVGTHIDKLGSERDTKMADLNHYLGSVIEENGFSHLIQYADKDKGQIMFAVDNTSESEDNFQLIRSRVNSLISNRSEFSIEYPISYLLFCLDLQNIKESIISLEDCRKLAAMHDIRGDQVLHLLRFLHLRIGLIRYYDVEGLRHLVIIEPQVLFNKATDLIALTFSTGSLFSREVTDLEKKGILSAKAFESLKSFSDKISPREFLQLLVHLRITVPVCIAGDKEGKYFIPCVLNHVSESVEKNQNTDYLCLCVKFKCNHCPKGIFGVLITHLMRPENNLSETSQGVSALSTSTLNVALPERIKFKLLEDKIFKDQVSFLVEYSGFVDEITLKLFFSHLEISFFPDLCNDRGSPSEVCNEIREIIEKSILSSLKDLHYKKERVGPMMCFKCEHCSDLHPIKGKRTYCKKFKKTSRIPPDGRCWFNESDDDDNGAKNAGSSQRCSTDALPQSSQHGQSVTNEPMKCPTLSKLTLIRWKDDDGVIQRFKLIKLISDKWDDIGTLVGLGTAQLNGIKFSCLNEANKCCKEVFSRWLEEENTSEYPKTWDGVCTLLEDIECANTAIKLRQALRYATS